jgi:hypothetical protein
MGMPKLNIDPNVLEKVLAYFYTGNYEDDVYFITNYGPRNCWLTTPLNVIEERLGHFPSYGRSVTFPDTSNGLSWDWDTLLESDSVEYSGLLSSIGDSMFVSLEVYFAADKLGMAGLRLLSMDRIGAAMMDLIMEASRIADHVNRMGAKGLLDGFEFDEDTELLQESLAQTCVTLETAVDHIYRFSRADDEFLRQHVARYMALGTTVYGTAELAARLEFAADQHADFKARFITESMMIEMDPYEGGELYP